ncbi:MAG TPA: hypothetical protein DGH68_12325 [Bacteroidetes bacterium]|nr:hypothetical protein [Bacteroidota bacterium]
MASQTRKITLDTAALFFGRAVGLLLGIVRLNYLATYLGVASFGILNFATYFTALFQSLFDLGMSQLMTREISRDPSRSGELLGKAVVLKLLIVCIASILVGCVTLISGFDRVTNWAVLLTTVALAINGVSTMFLSSFQAHRKMITVSIANIANDVIVSVAVILMIPNFPSVITALVLTVVVSLINLGILIRVYYQSVGRPNYQANRESWRLMLKEGTPMAVSALGISTYTFIGPTVLKYTRGETEVGLYSAGYKLISILTLIPVTFTQVVYPIFADFYANAPQKLGKALRDALRVMSLISFPLAVGTFILAPKIISTLYPGEFSGAAVVLQLIILGNALGYLSQILYSFLLALNKQTACMIDLLSVAIAVTIGSLVFVPTFGYEAVALIFMLTDIALFLSLFYLTFRTGHHVGQFSAFVRILVAALVMGGVLLLVRDWYPVLSIPIGCCVYAAMLFALRVFGDQETELLNKLIIR